MAKGKDQPIKGYRLIRALGSGGMGTVYLAAKETTQEQVGIKVMRPSLKKKEGLVDRLHREAELVLKLDHPNIVKGLEVGRSGEYHYFVMEYVKGKSVRDLLNEGKVFSETEALQIAVPVVEALCYSQQAGVIHRDIKPGNIMLSDEGTVKLTDLGLAKESVDSSITQSGATVGTPQYISPEQARDPRDVDIRTDIYSLGATLYHMVTGSPPFEGETLAQVVAKVLFKKPVSLERAQPELSPSFCAVLSKMMKKERRLRYQRPEGLREDLRAVLAGKEVLPSGEVEEKEEPAGQKRSLFLGAFAALLVISIAVIAYFTFFYEAPEPNPSEKSKPTPDLISGIEEEERNLGRGRGLLFALERYGDIAITHADETVREKARAQFNARKKELEGSFSYLQKIVDEDLEQLIEKKYFPEAQAALSLLGEETKLLEKWEKRSGIPFQHLPPDLLGPLLEKVRLKKKELGTRLSMAAKEHLVGLIPWYRKIEEVDFAKETERWEGIEKSAVELKACLSSAHLSKVEEKTRRSRDKLLSLAEDAIFAAEVKIEQLLKEESRKYTSAKKLLSELEAGGAADLVEGAYTRVQELKNAVEEGERSSLNQAEDQYGRFQDQFYMWAGERKYEEAFREGQGWLKHYQENMLEENRLLRKVIDNYQKDLDDLTLVMKVWEKVEKAVRGMEGKSVKLLFRRDRSLKNVERVEGGKVFFRSIADGPLKERALRELETEEVERLGGGEGADEFLGVGIFLLLESRSAGSFEAERQKSLLQRAAEAFSRPQGERGVTRYLDQIDDAREEIDSRRQDLEKEFRQLVKDVKERGEGKLFEAAKEALNLLKTEGKFRMLRLRNAALLTLLERELRALEREEGIRSLFKGTMTFLSEKKDRIRLVYTFQNDEELQDWEFDKNRWRLQDGLFENFGGRIFATFGDERNLFKEEIGLRHKVIPSRAFFSLARGFIMEFDYLTSDAYAPFFFAVSLNGNNLGIFSPPNGYSGQVNFFQGKLEEYEEWFFKENALEAAPRGLKKGFRFEQGRAYSIRIETREDSKQGKWMAVYVDNKKIGERRFKHFLGRRQGTFHLEIRTWRPHRFRNFKFEGDLELR